MDKTPPEKICTQCLASKPLKDFRNDKYRPDGKSLKCRECKKKRDKELYDLNPEPRRASTAKWREENPEKRQSYEDAHREERKEKRRKRYAEDPEAELMVNRAYYWLHKETLRPVRAAWEVANQAKRKATKASQYLENPEPHRMSRKAWEAAHPGYGAVKWQRRASRQAGAEIVDLSPEQWEEIKAAFQWRCAYCPTHCKACKAQTHDLEQEHITPVSKGGNYTVHNIVPSCQLCNTRKYNGPPPIAVQPLLLTEALPYIPKKKRS